jgi:hypothetical protein
MPKLLSAVDAVSPAIERAKQQLFMPFRFWHWARMAFVAIITGEFAGGGGGGGGGNIPIPDSKKTNDFAWLAAPDATWGRIIEYLPLIILAVALIAGLVLIWMFVASVFRFVLFDSVLYNRCQIRAGWRRFQELGYSYFLWSVCLGFSVLVAVAVAVGGPIFLAWRAGVFREPKEHLILLILGGVALFFLLMAVIVAGLVIGLLAKDFAVPVMALENVGIRDAWRRLLPLLASQKLSYAGYVLMKIVLAVGSAIIFGIINLIAILILAIPLVIGGIAGYVIAKGAGVPWNLATMSIVVILVLGAFLLLLTVAAFISVPAVVFFQSYPMYFFGSRYPALGSLLFPPPTPPVEPLPPPPAPVPIT